MTTWLTDARGNKCSVEYFGSREEAQRALDSLQNCDNSINCSDCSDCSDCSGCSYCSYCSGCSGSSDCSDCSGCSGCSYCSDCSDCSYCSGCSDCSGSSDVAWRDNKQKLKGDPDAAPATLGQPPIPKIKNIHAHIFEAVSQPGALDMSAWHTCGTTHCRAGWVVHLAGAAGYALERFHNTALAAQLIYRESGYKINPGRFFDDNETAMADMKRLSGADNA